MKKYLSDDEVKIKLFEGDYNPVILNYIDFACYLADKYSRRSFTHSKEDLRGVAILTLVESVYKLQGHPKPRAYLRLRIRGAVINTCTRDHEIINPDMGERLEKWVYLEDIPKDQENLSLPKEIWSSFDPTDRLVKARIFDSIFLSVLEKEIIKLKLEGLTNEEVAKLCSKPKSQIQRIIQGTRTRIRNILNEVY